jgi:hypothetical protein
MKECQSVFDFFEKYRMEFVASRTDESFGLYSELINKFDTNGIATILGVPVFKEGRLIRVFIGIVDVHRSFTGNRRFLNKYNLTIIKYAVYQLSESIKRIMNNCMIKAINQELAKSAVTDQLTGIYNRMGMGKIVQDGISDKGVVLYLDLDKMYRTLESAGLNIDIGSNGEWAARSILPYFNNNQANMANEAFYNSDAEYKYIRPAIEGYYDGLNKKYIDPGAAPYLYAAQGDRSLMREYFVTNRIKFLRGKHNSEKFQ